MNPSRFPRSSAVFVTALSIAMGTAAQSRTHAAVAGNTDVRVLNVAHARAVTSSTPSVALVLWSEGRFLGYRGRYYTVELAGHGSVSGGAGVYRFYVGRDLVRSGLMLPFLSPRATQSMTRDLWARDAEQSFSVGGLPVIVQGNVRLDLNVDAMVTALRGSLVTVEGRTGARGTARTSARIGLPVWYLGARTTGRLSFGEQEFDGRAQASAVDWDANLAYRMDPIELRLRACVTFSGLPVLCATIVDSLRSAVSIASFL